MGDAACGDCAALSPHAPRAPLAAASHAARLTLDAADPATEVRLAHDGKNVHVSLLKDHDNPRPSPARLALDPVTMLLIEEHYVDLDPAPAG